MVKLHTTPTLRLDFTRAGFKIGDRVMLPDWLGGRTGTVAGDSGTSSPGAILVWGENMTVVKIMLSEASEAITYEPVLVPTHTLRLAPCETCGAPR